MICRNVVSGHTIFIVTPGKIFGRTGYLTVNKMALHRTIGDGGMIFLSLWKEIRLHVRYKR